MFTELGFSAPLGLPMCIDNKSFIQVTKTPEHHGRMKHLDLHFYWLRCTVHSGVIALKYVPTADMVADSTTKALSRSKVAKLRILLGLRLW